MEKNKESYSGEISPFLVLLQDKKLTIVIPISYTVILWSKWYGEIQRIIFETFYDDLLFDFSKCEYSDIVPLSYILLDSKQILLQKKNVIISPPNDEVFFEWLKRNGFYKQFKNFTNTIDTEKHSIQKMFTAPLLPFTIIELENLENKSLSTIIDDLYQEMLNTLSLLITSEELDDLSTKLYNFINESIENVYLHAFEESTREKLCCIYVRMRHGLLGISDHKDRKYYIKYNKIKDECRNHPGIKEEYFLENDNFIDINISDNGNGFIKTIENRALKEPEIPEYKALLEDKLFTRKFKLRYFFIEVLKNGRRINRSKNEYNSHYGGLHLLSKIMSSTKDLLYFYSEGEYIIAQLPIREEKDIKSEYTFFRENSGQYVSGFNILGRFSWQKKPANYEKNSFIWNGKPLEHPIYNSFKEIPSYQFSKEKIYSLDYRFKDAYEGLDAINPKTFSDYKESSSNDKYFFLLPQSKVLKKNVTEIIREFCDNLGQSGIDKTLIIAEISPLDFVTFIFALERTSVFNNSHLSIFNKIILLSKRLEVSVFEMKHVDVNRFIYRYSDEKSKDLFCVNKNDSFHPDIYISDILFWLRRHDSFIFWDQIAKNDSVNQIFIKGDIKWNDNLVIDSYLDFLQTLTIPICKKLYLDSIERLRGIYGLQECQFESINLLTKELCIEANKQNTSKSKKRIFLTGISLSGSTIDNHISVTDNSNEMPLFSFFLHPNNVMEIKYPFLFLWTKHVDSHFFKQQTKSSMNYERIKNTHALSLNGNKYYIHQRFTDERVEKSLYFRTPSETYNDLQKDFNPFVKIDHLVYGDHHDLININIEKLFRDSYQKKNELAIFLISELFFSLGGNISKDLSLVGKEWKNEIVEYEKKFKGRISLFVVYLYHENTRSIIELIKKLFSDRLKRKFFPLIPAIEHSFNRSILITSLVAEPIKEIISSYKATISDDSITALYFDDISVSGRSRNEVSSILKSFGVNQIQILNIIDRQRLPFYKLNPENERVFWRLDLPRLGNESTCPICRALDRIKSIERFLISTEMKNRINNWNKDWEPSNSFSIFDKHGMPQLKVILDNPKKELSIKNEDGFWRQKGGNNELITLKDLTGTCLYLTEMNAITHQNDLVYIYCTKESQLDDQSKIALICSQLLLFNYDYNGKLLNELLELLVDLLLSNTENNFSSLASMVLIIQKPIILEKIIKYISLKENRNIENLDILLVFCTFMIRYNNNAEAYLSKWKYRRFIKQSKLYNILKALHEELIDESGGTHSRPLPYIVNNPIIREEDKVNRYRDAIMSLDNIIYLLNEFQPSIFRTNCIEKNEFCLQNNSEECQYLPINKENINEKAYELIDEIKSFIYEHKKINRKLLESTFSHLLCLHHSLFFKISKSKFHNSFNRVIKNIHKSIDWNTIRDHKSKNKKDIILKYFRNRKENYSKYKVIYILWIKPLENEIKNIIINLLHSAEAYSRDSEYSPSEKASMWFSYYFDDKIFYLQFYNLSKNNSVYIEKEFKKNRIDFDYLALTNVSFAFSHKEKNGKYEVILEVRIPLILSS